MPNSLQTENYLIKKNTQWEKIGEYKESLDGLVDTPNSLWVVLNGESSSTHGELDRIHCNLSSQFNNSLYLIKPSEFTIIVQKESNYTGEVKLKKRAEFIYNNYRHKLAITDPTLPYFDEGSYKYNTQNIYLCISVGLPYNGYSYKLVASIIGL